jgi:hypothetical protein
MNKPTKPTREAVALYDALCALVREIKDDPEASREYKALARAGRAALNKAKAAWYPKP